MGYLKDVWWWYVGVEAKLVPCDRGKGVKRKRISRDKSSLLLLLLLLLLAVLCCCRAVLLLVVLFC